jgi:hypothetical protein
MDREVEINGAAWTRRGRGFAFSWFKWQQIDTTTGTLAVRQTGLHWRFKFAPEKQFDHAWQ